jgi:acetate kinase
MTSPAGRVLVLNAGSATLKMTVLDLPDAAPLFDHSVDWEPRSRSAISDAVDTALHAAARSGIDRSSVAAVGHRVVHGGPRFVAPTLLDEDTVAALDEIADLAPLHNPVAVETIRVARKRLPAAPQVAAFDTAFHATMPEVARRYPVPDGWVRDHGIRRYGFHGLSVEWSVGRTASLLGRPPEDLRILVAHLGGGSSVTAVDGGRSIDTSMGLTPLEGLMMATRAGSIDPGIVFRLMRDGAAADDIERQLDHESGLVGVGGTSDMRRLLDKERSGDQRAILAIDLFVRRAAAGIAAIGTSLPRLDALVFTGGIGEHAATVRSRICARLGLLGVPPIRDGATDGDAILERGSTGVSVLKVHAREDLVIANEALGLASG